MDIGKNIERLRKERGLSRSKLSFRSLISQNHLFLIERGKNPNLTLNSLQRIAEALEVDITELFKEPKAA